MVAGGSIRRIPKSWMERHTMDALASMQAWPTPIGLGIFFAGLGILLWGASHFHGKKE
jgi:hypothetical protein